MDTGATYIYKMYEKIIEKQKYVGTYQDDDFTIFQDHNSIKQTIYWLNNFQLQVDGVVNSSFFHFTIG